jgi:hypothetical protein
LATNCTEAIAVVEAEHRQHAVVDSAHPQPAGVVAGTAHDRDDLLDRRWIGRVAQSLVAWRATAR